MRKIVKGGLYRHFKGMYYYVLDVATHSETSEQFVVYQKLYDQRDLYVRPLDMFLSDVDQEKYPDVEQKPVLRAGDIQKHEIQYRLKVK